MSIGNVKFEFPIRAEVSLLVGVALLIAACSRSDSTVGLSKLKPIDQAALQTMIDNTAKELLIPGAVVLLRTPQGEFTVTYGTTLLGAASPPSAGTYFRIASNTKTLTAAVIMRLAQENKLSLDDPISKYVLGVPNGDNITIAELLEMRSGLYNYTNDPIISATIDTEPSQGLDPRRVTDNCIRAPTEFLAGYAVRVRQHQLCASWSRRRENRWQTAAADNARPVVRAARFATHRASCQNREHDSRTVLAWLPVRQLLGRVDRRTALLAQDSGCSTSWHPAAEGLYGSEPFLCYVGWGRHFHCRRSRHLIKALVAGHVLDSAYQRRWLDSPKPEDPSKPTAKNTDTVFPNLAGDRTRSIFTAARPPATTRKSATTRPTTRRSSCGRICLSHSTASRPPIPSSSKCSIKSIKCHRWRPLRRRSVEWSRLELQLCPNRSSKPIRS